MNEHVVILVTGASAAVACSLLGTFLVLRGMSLIGDAISHAVLPGIIVAFLITNNVGSLTVILGAGAVGLLTVFLIESLLRTKRVKQDASIAVVFPALFAVGVLLLARFVEHKDLDQECVLYGEILFAPYDLLVIAGLEVARPMLILGTVALLNLFFVVALYKELKLATFDAATAATLGISPVVVHYLLMGMVSVTTVASFDSIGAILVVAFLIVPAASAYLLTDRLHVMLALAAGIGAGSSAIGYWIARQLNSSIAGSMAMTMGAVFVLVWMFAPRQGVISKLLARRSTRRRFASAMLISRLEKKPANAGALAKDLAWQPAIVEELIEDLKNAGLVSADGERLRATDGGVRFLRAVLG